MTNPIESMMYGVSQFFLYPVLLAIAGLFVHAFYALGAFVWQAWQRLGLDWQVRFTPVDIPWFRGRYLLPSALAASPQLLKLEAVTAYK